MHLGRSRLFGVTLALVVVSSGCTTVNEWSGTSEFGTPTPRTVGDNVDRAVRTLRRAVDLDAALEREAREAFLAEAERVVVALRAYGLGVGIGEGDPDPSTPRDVFDAMRREVRESRRATDAKMRALLAGDDLKRYTAVAAQVHRDLARPLPRPAPRRGRGWGVEVGKTFTYP